MHRVLLIDDETIFLEFMQTVCDWGSHQCEIIGCAEDGKKALDMILSEKPDIAFVDVNIPIMDGLEVCRKVKEEGLPVKLVIVTAHDEFRFAYQAIKLGINDFLLKPFSREELETSLDRIIRSIDIPEQQEDPALQDTFHQEESSTKFEIMASTIDEYLRDHFTDPDLTMKVLSGDLSFESSYLRRVYKAVRGSTITQRLETMRIEEAKRLLKTGQYQIREVSYLSGFSDPYYFSRRFKQITGITPTDFVRS